MSRQEELQKLFDYIVDHEREPNPFTEEVLKAQKKFCLIMWPQEAGAILFRAVKYAEKHPLETVQ